MTVSEITTEVRQIIQQLDPTNSNVTDSSILGWINACTLQLCSIISTLPKTEFTIVAAETITLAQTLLKVDFASIKDKTSGVHSPIKTIDYCNFVRTHPNYQNEPANRPEYLVRLTDLTWTMWPSPVGSAYAGADVTLVGTTIPANLTLTTEEPPVSKAMHTVYSHYCAWKAFLLLNNPERAAAEYAAYDALKKINMQATTSTTGNLLAFKVI
jgi:hypothetical protein